MTPVTTTGRWRVPWIEALPDGWQFLSAKRLFQPRPELASVDEPQLAATQAYGVIEQAEYERRVGRKVTKLNKNLDKRRLVKRDDFIISMRSFEGGLERAWAEGGIRSSYIVLKPAAEISVGYYQHLFKSQPYIQALRATGNFIRDGQDLNYSNFSLVDLPYPPLEDQALIARYLDWHGAMTGKLIRAKRRLIALLNEQKQSIILRAVTRGLNPSATLKPSGVDWLGDVPEHWEVIPPKRLLTSRSSGSAPIKNTASDVPLPGYYPAYSASGQDVWLPEAKFSGPALILSAVGARCGKTFLADGDWAVTANTHILFVPPSQSLRYWWFVTNLPNWWERAGAAQPFVQVARTIEKKWAVPSLDEQKKIVAQLEDDLAGLDATIGTVQREIALINEFRTRLIADAVTGQLDVRDIAASLPEVAEAGMAGDLTDDDDLDDDADDLIEEEEAA